MPTLQVFKVEKWDGGDRTNFAYYLSNKHAAEKYAATHTYDIVTPVTLQIYDTVEAAESDRPENIRKRAIDALKAGGFTDEQIAKLGVR